MASETRLEDLFKRWAPVEITDPETGRSATVVVMKANRPQKVEMTKRADAARARVLSLRSTPDSDGYMAIKNAALEITDRAQLVNELIGEDAMNIRIRTEAELAAGETWSEDNYLDGLQRAWSDSLQDVYADEPDNAEAQRVLAELNRFTEEVTSQVADEIEQLRAQFQQTAIEELQELVMPVMLREAADAAWAEEYYRSEVWLCTHVAVAKLPVCPQCAGRLADAKDVKSCTECDWSGDAADATPVWAPGERYYKNRHDADAIDDEVYVQLHRAIRNLTLGGYEGKDSPPSPASSDSSESSEPAVTDVSSGQPAAVL
jgi:hypothetical protein